MSFYIFIKKKKSSDQFEISYDADVKKSQKNWSLGSISF